MIQRALLALPELHNGHAGEETGPHIVATLKAYNLIGHLGMITGDNATCNDTMCRAVERILSEEHKVQWDAVEHRGRCQAHILNIASQAFFFATDAEAFDIAVQRSQNSADSRTLLDEISSLSDLQDSGFCKHETMVKLYGLAIELRTLKYNQAFKRLAGRIIRIPGKTRWNGWYLMLLEAGQLRPFVVQLIDQFPELEQYRFTPSNWDVIEATKKFLQPFYDLTLMLEESQVTLDKVQESMEALIFHYKQSEVKHSGNRSLLAAINTSWHSFNTWYEKLDQSPFYVTAVLLHPSRRLEGLKKIWKPYKGAVPAGLARAKKLWSQYRDRYTTAVVAPQDTTEEPSIWELYSRQMDVVPAEDDFSTFINAKPVKLPPAPPPEEPVLPAGLLPLEGPAKPPVVATITPLQWWSSPNQRASYPALSRLAIDVFSAFAQSAVSEGTFSSTRRTIPWERALLGGKIVEETECCHDWQVTGLAYDDRYIVMDSEDDDDGDAILSESQASV